MAREIGTLKILENLGQRVEVLVNEDGSIATHEFKKVDIQMLKDMNIDLSDTVVYTSLW